MSGTANIAVSGRSNLAQQLTRRAGLASSAPSGASSCTLYIYRTHSLRNRCHRDWLENVTAFELALGIQERSNGDKTSTISK
jgi:hypothetical protein